MKNTKNAVLRWDYDKYIYFPFKTVPGQQQFDSLWNSALGKVFITHNSFIRAGLRFFGPGALKFVGPILAHNLKS